MTILITGCSSGIGYFCAKELHKEGHKVLATCREKKDVERLKSEGLEAYVLDLNSSQSIKDGFEWAKSRDGGKIDVLFNNGAYGQPGAIEDLSRDVLREQFETNVFGWVELTNLVIPIMRKSGFGRLVFNSSVLGFVSMKYRGAYNSSKYAIEGICDTLRLELKGSGIDVVLIEPGPIKSRFRDNALKKFLQNIKWEESAHIEAYKNTLKRLESKSKTPFELNEDAVYDALLKSISAKNPKARYRVTTPTKLFWFFKRVLPTKVLDNILGRVD